MPKKSTPARGGVQRTKAKQKGFELVRPASTSQEEEVDTNTEQTAVEVSTARATVATTASRQNETSVKKERLSSTPTRSQTSAVVEKEDIESEDEPELVASAPKGSASARLAARRQAGQRTQRTATALITAEHYSYVRRDLIFIAILAVILFATIIALHFVPGIGS